tara:strand:- start:890 stop:1465 length:576 start_codon:yes stop_codon:yes gene_type:complete
MEELVSSTGKTYISEPVSMSNPVFDKIINRVSKSYPNSCVCFINEIKNNTLQKAFDNKKIEIENRLKNENSHIEVKIEQLFHGTNKSAIESICKTGFLTRFNRTSAYGKGTYFARDAQYSFSYMRDVTHGLSYMFLADVLVGNKQRGSSGNRAPHGVDNWVDNIQNTSIYVTPYDAGAYPRYVIAFHKNAK